MCKGVHSKTEKKSVKRIFLKFVPIGLARIKTGVDQFLFTKVVKSCKTDRILQLLTAKFSHMRGILLIILHYKYMKI
jgi:hypothetical protein